MSRRVFAINYVLKGTDGAVIDASEANQPLPFLEGAGQIIPALEEQIKGLKEGDKKTVQLKAADAYGLPEDKMKMDVLKAELNHIPDLKVGSYLRLDLSGEAKVVRVTAMTDESVTLDGNHPLAGQDLVFSIEMVLVRDATLEELTHGHAHGLHGHSHH
jgi:FKBP-type peptidyl-prolyl cis-trans isomerase SlyD